jgi:hypothetical protein
MGGVPPVPTPSAPVNGTVLDGSSAYRGSVIMPPDENGMSVRAPLELAWTLPELLTARDGTRVLAIPDTTHYRICVFEPDRESICDTNNIPRNIRGIVRYVKTCDQSPTFSAPGGGLAGFQPQSESRVTELNWKLQACNRNRFRCSGWSEKRKLKWLPPPAILSPAHRSVYASRGPGDLGAKLVVNAVADAEEYRFCIARTNDRCPEMVTYSQPDIPNPVPLVRKAQATTPEIALSPQIELGTSDTAVPLQSWFDGLTVNWTVAACVTLPNTEEIADESRRMGCVYQEQPRSITFAR